MIEDNSLNMSGLMKGDERAFQSLFIDYYPLLVSSANLAVLADKIAQVGKLKSELFSNCSPKLLLIMR